MNFESIRNRLTRLGKISSKPCKVSTKCNYELEDSTSANGASGSHMNINANAMGLVMLEEGDDPSRGAHSMQVLSDAKATEMLTLQKSDIDMNISQHPWDVTMKRNSELADVITTQLKHIDIGSSTESDSSESDREEKHESSITDSDDNSVEPLVPQTAVYDSKDLDFNPILQDTVTTKVDGDDTNISEVFSLSSPSTASMKSFENGPKPIPEPDTFNTIITIINTEIDNTETIDGKDVKKLEESNKTRSENKQAHSNKDKPTGIILSDKPYKSNENGLTDIKNDSKETTPSSKCPEFGNDKKETSPLLRKTADIKNNKKVITHRLRKTPDIKNDKAPTYAKTLNDVTSMDAINKNALKRALHNSLSNSAASGLMKSQFLLGNKNTLTIPKRTLSVHLPSLSNSSKLKPQKKPETLATSAPACIEIYREAKRNKSKKLNHSCSDVPAQNRKQASSKLTERVSDSVWKNGKVHMTLKPHPTPKKGNFTKRNNSNNEAQPNKEIYRDKGTSTNREELGNTHSIRKESTTVSNLKTKLHPRFNRYRPARNSMYYHAYMSYAHGTFFSFAAAKKVASNKKHKKKEDSPDYDVIDNRVLGPTFDTSVPRRIGRIPPPMEYPAPKSVSPKRRYKPMHEVDLYGTW